MDIKLPVKLGGKVLLSNYKGEHLGWLVGIKKGLFCEYEYTIQVSKDEIRDIERYTSKDIEESKATLKTFDEDPVVVINPFSFNEEVISGYFGLKEKTLRFIGIWYDLSKDEYHYRFMDDARLKTFISKELLEG